MPSPRKLPPLRAAGTTALAALLLVACGGGGDADQTLAQQSFSSADAAVLFGDWPAMHYVVRDQAGWDAAWAARRAGLDCTRAYNAPACASATPPPVDFTRDMVIGLHLAGEVLRTDRPTTVTERASDGRIVVSYAWNALIAPFQPKLPAVYFFKVQARSAQVVFEPSPAQFSGG